MTLRIGSLFTGYGGLDDGVRRAVGGTVAWVSDIDPGACKILAHHHPDTPNLGDITGIDWSTVEPVDVLTGGFPCQDVSIAGRRAGIRPGTRSGLWEHFAYAIDQLRPRLVVIENVRGLLSTTAHSDVEPCPLCVGDDTDGALRALGAVLGDLADIRYDTVWHGLRAADVGAPHARFRVFVVAYPAGDPWRLAHRNDASTPDPASRRRREHDPDLRGLPVTHTGDHNGASLTGALLPTPRATDGTNGGPNQRGSSGDLMLPSAVHQLLPTRGTYAPAIEHWQNVTGHPVPPPTETGPKGGQRLSPRFVEWMMGLPPGHVTDTPITRNAQLRALGNGVVPQQAAEAVRYALSWCVS